MEWAAQFRVLFVTFACLFGPFFLLDIKVFLIAGWWSWWEELMVLVETDHFLYHCIGFSCLMTSFIDFVCYYSASTFPQLFFVVLFFFINGTCSCRQ